MEVVTHLTSAFMIAVSLALVAFGFWFDVKRRAKLRQKRTLISSDLNALAAAVEPNLPPIQNSDISHAHSLEGFLCQHAPAENDLHIYAKHALFGPVLKPITVHNGGQLMLFAPCVASIIVRRGGIAFVYDLVTGDLINEGGELHVYGTVIGAIRKNDGATHIHPVARFSSPQS